MISLSYHGMFILLFLSYLVFISSFCLGFAYSIYCMYASNCKLHNYFVKTICDKHAARHIHDHDCATNNTWKGSV